MTTDNREQTKAPLSIDARHSLISKGMDQAIVLIVVVAIIILSLRGDMDKATTGSLLGIVLGHAGTAAAQNLRSRRAPQSYDPSD